MNFDASALTSIETSQFTLTATDTLGFSASASQTITVHVGTSCPCSFTAATTNPEITHSLYSDNILTTTILVDTHSVTNGFKAACSTCSFDYTVIDDSSLFTVDPIAVENGSNLDVTIDSTDLAYDDSHVITIRATD